LRNAVPNALALELGRALRGIRRARGLRLRDLGPRSGGWFSATGVAGYERGERAISVGRFCALCEIYGVDADRMLADALRAARGRPRATIDLGRVETVAHAGAELLVTTLERILAMRGATDKTAVTIRSSDVQVLATALGRSPEELIADIGAAR
jgi:transcriptional regulator with XRE-family HTH domain